MLKIRHISYQGKEDDWIMIEGTKDFVSDDPYDIADPKEFVTLVKEYAAQLSGKVKSYSRYNQYKVGKDPLGLIFQFDDLFGMSVIVPKKIDIKIAEKTIQTLCDRVNNKTQ